MDCFILDCIIMVSYGNMQYFSIHDNFHLSLSQCKHNPNYGKPFSWIAKAKRSVYTLAEIYWLDGWLWNMYIHMNVKNCMSNEWMIENMTVWEGNSQNYTWDHHGRMNCKHYDNIEDSYMWPDCDMSFIPCSVECITLFNYFSHVTKQTWCNW